MPSEPDPSVEEPAQRASRDHGHPTPSVEEPAQRASRDHGDPTPSVEEPAQRASRDHGDRLTLVAAYAEGRVIGDHGRIPWHVPDDFAHFKATTMGGVLVMGRATYDSIGRPLPGRTTVVVTRNPDWNADGVLVAHSVADALSLAAEQPGEVFIAGGTQVYEQTLPLATHQVLTEVHLSVEGDAHYPEFDLDEWVETRRISRDDLDWVWWERPRGIVLRSLS